MRLDKPRVQPVPDTEWTDDQRAYLEPFAKNNRLYNVFRTLARHPKLATPFGVFGGYILGDSTLSPRHREMLILRIGWLCRAEYEWAQHSRIGLQSGLSEPEIRRIAEGPHAGGWTPFEAALLNAVDELHGDAFISDATWRALSTEFNEQNLMDLVFTVGEYTLVSMALNTFGVQLDDGLTGFPK